MHETANVLQETLNLEVNISASCSRQVTVLVDDVALNARVFLIDHALGDLKRDNGENGAMNV